MPRLPADIRISLKRRGGRTHRIELVRNSFKQRFWVRRDGKQSARLPEATATDIRRAVFVCDTTASYEPEPDVLRQVPPPDRPQRPPKKL